MRLQKLSLIALALLISASGLWAQEKKKTDKKEKNQMVIIKKTVDADGKEVTERIVRDLDAEGEQHFEYKGEDGAIIKLKMDGENSWHSIDQDIHIISDDEKELEIIDIKDLDMMSDELEEHLEKINIRINDLNNEKRIEIRVTDEDGEGQIIEWQGDGEVPEEIQQKIKEHKLHKGHFEFKNDFQFQSSSNKAFLGVVSGKKVEVTNENGVETRTEDDYSDVDGAYVESVIEGSAAEAAGLQGGDVITNIDGTTISGFSDLSDKLGEYEVGDQINISYVRNNANAQTTATLGERKHEAKNLNFEWKDKDGEELHFEEGNKFFFKEGDHDEDDGNHVIILHKDDEDGKKIKERIVIITKSEADSDEEEVEVEVTVEVITDDEEEPAVEEPVETPADLEIIPERQLEIADFDAYPNPTDGQIQVRFTAPAKPTKLTITNVDGREVYRDQIKNFDGNYNKQINLKGVPKGTLILSITQDDQVFTKQIILQ